MCHVNNEKRETTRDRQNGTSKSRKNQNAWRKGNLQILENTGSEHHQTSRDDRKILKDYPRRTKKLLETKLYGRNLLKEINTWVVLLVRYSGPFLKWTREELKQMDQRTRKLMTIHKTLHSRDDIDRLHVSRKGKRGVTSMEDSVDASIQQFEVYIKKRGERLITATRNNTINTRINRTTITRKQKWEEKQSYGHSKRLTTDISHEKHGCG